MAFGLKMVVQKRPPSDCILAFESNGVLGTCIHVSHNPILNILSARRSILVNSKLFVHGII